MTANIAHFSINADDLERARAFYGNVFGWRFSPWGPPGFFLIATGDDANPGIQGALQGRRALVAGEKTIGFECTIGVADVAAAERSIVANGGTIVLPRATIPGVGELFFFRDPEGNVACAMQYDPTYKRPDVPAPTASRR